MYAVCLTHLNSTCNQSKSPESIFVEQEKEKKRKYQQIVIDVEMGSFTPLVFGTNGGMGKECKLFLSNLANKLSRKKTASRMPVPYLGLNHAYLLKF